MRSPLLTMAMPAYNEQACIRPVVEAWLRLIQAVAEREGAACGMVVVNDGSEDSTGAILDELALAHPELKVVHQKNAGHGAAVLNAYTQACHLGSAWIFQVDSDDQFEPADFWKLWARRSSSPFILGRRLDRSDPLHRLVITRIARALSALLFGRDLKDANVPFRLIQGPLLAAMLGAIPSTLFAPNLFLSVLARGLGYDTLDIAVTHRERQTGKVSIVGWKLIKNCFRVARELFAFRQNWAKSTALVKAALAATDKPASQDRVVA